MTHAHAAEPPRKAPSAESEISPPIVQEVVTSPGQPMDATTRGTMESRWGHDFSRVRVHTDARAAQSAAAVHAHAYTVGWDIVFGADRYRPDTAAGQRLLGHELVHSLQQRDAVPPPDGQLAIGPPDSAAEHAAQRARTDVVGGTLVVARQVIGEGEQTHFPVAAPAHNDATHLVPADELPAEPLVSDKPPQAPEPGVGVTLSEADRKEFAEHPTPVEFYLKYAELALADQRATGVPALVTLAQMAVESGWAMGESASFFGIKGNPNAKPDTIQWLWTTEPVGSQDSVRAQYQKYPEFADKDPEPGAKVYRVRLPFVRYDSVGEAIAGHSRALHAKPYAAVWGNTADPVKFAQAVGKAGYSATAGYGQDIANEVSKLNKAAAFARETNRTQNEAILGPASRMAAILTAHPSSEGISRARGLIPAAIPGAYTVLSDQGLAVQLLRLKNILESMGVPADVAKDVCKPARLP